MTALVFMAVLLAAIGLLLSSGTSNSSPRQAHDLRGKASSGSRGPASAVAKMDKASSRGASAWIAELEAKARSSHVPGHLAPGSNPKVLPGPILIADRNNSRLLLVDPKGQVLWQYPPPGNPSLANSLPSPDDAFFGPHGHHILATEESQFVITKLSVPSGNIVWRYGHLGRPGSGPGYLDNPDDGML